MKQESLANAKVSADSLGMLDATHRPPLRVSQQ